MMGQEQNNKKIKGYNPMTGEPIYESEPSLSIEQNNKKIKGYNPMTGEPIYEHESSLNVGQNPNNNQMNYQQPNQQMSNVNSNQLNLNNEPIQKTKKPNVGLIIGIVVIIVVVFAIGGFKFIKKQAEQAISLPTNIFYGDGFDLRYDARWSEGTFTGSDGQTTDTLMYGNEESYLLKVGDSALSEFEEEYNIDFDNDDGKKKVYEEFYKAWNNNNNLFGGSGGFGVLKNDIYYATMDYGSSAYNITSKLYLVVSPENNIIISFLLNSKKDLEENNKRAIEVLKTINIEKTYDNEMANILDSMSAWNQYADVRTGILGKTKDITGGWRILSNSETYWEFKGNEYWWYKSLNDLNDNYWYGTTRILTGKEGLKEVGLDEDKVDKIVANSSGTVTADNIYTIILTPSKIISDGEDKSDTNISGGDWHYVWIIVDHGKEGLEAQVLNAKTADISYYVKVKD